jgi:succinoglycan biosynthesis protein ExoA
MLTDSISAGGVILSPDQESCKALFISVIVPVRNEARFIERTLTHLVLQDYAPERFEVLVVDGQSTDGTPDLVTQFAAQHQNVRLLANPKRLSSAARNIGIQNAQGDVVVIVDGHCEIEDDQHLSKLAAAFERSGADCLGRPQPLDVSDATPVQRAIAAARSSRLGHHPDSFIYSSGEQFVPAASVAVAYRRSVFEKVGYFDERFDACEDVEFNHRIDRAGLRCYFTPTIAVRYQPRASLLGLFRQLVRYGRGRVRLLRKHPETMAIRTLLPATFLLGIIGGSAAFWLSPWLALVYLTAIGLYCGLVLATSGFIAAAHRDLAILPWLPLVFLTIHAACGVGLLVEAFCGKRLNHER